MQHIVTAVVLGSFYTLVALGLTLSWGVLNVLNLAHGATIMFGALLAYVITDAYSLPLVVVLPATMIGCGLVTTALWQFAYKPVSERARDGEEGALTTLIAAVGAAAVLVAIGRKVTEGAPVGLPSELFSVKSTSVFGAQTTNLGIIVTLTALALGAAMAWFIRSTRTGRALRGLAENPYAVALMGVSQNRLAYRTLFVSGALAGGAGLLLAFQLGAVDAHMGDPFLLKAFAVIILGGVGSIAGAMVGAYLLAFAETYAQVYASGDIKDAIAFMLIIAVLLIRPQGLFAQKTGRRA